MNKVYIGIDAGVSTGIAIWDADKKKFECIGSMMIHKAMEAILLYSPNVKVFVEDARQRKWFGKSGREKLQGAGSVKRDCKIWEDFLTDRNIDFEMVAPKNNKTKMDSSTFKKVTGWQHQTNVHGRDAAMLVFGR